MKLSIFYQHITSASEMHGISEEDVLKKAYDMGYRGLECEYSLFKDCKKDFKDMVKRTGFEIVSVPYYGYFNDGFDTKEIENVIDDILYMGCKKILSIPGLIALDSPTYKKELQNIKAGLSALCEIANKRGLEVSIEEYDNVEAPFGRMSEIKDFLDTTNGLKFNLDTGNFYPYDEDVFTAIDMFKEKICHVHLKNRRIEPLCESETFQLTSSGQKMYPSPIGQGQIDMKKIIEVLREISYDDYCTVEHFGEVDQLLYMEKSAQWAKDYINL